ncbi:MAG: 30S ribosomal protein S17 [Candidatus Diapherotrites archaeon CG10_big_fil_rev_8_21_14_0_10_31_34]|nr:MAG: 30S ribosomal protein S17 [Candidatus Diapherotrites archaeon CG10_big_fil_rev_8_21_14_0_10_31_34]
MTECKDKNCPKHGNIKVRGNVFTGKVISDKGNKTITIERILTKKIPKYERYKKIRSKITAHNPKCINAQEGNKVKIGETRRISKTKSFVVLEVESNESD